MTEQSKEGVALELVKILLEFETERTRESVLGLFSECMGVVNGDALEVVRHTLKLQKAAVDKPL